MLRADAHRASAHSELRSELAVSVVYRICVGVRNVFRPELVADPTMVGAPAHGGEVLGDAVQIAIENGSGLGVVPSVDDLWEVDQEDAPAVIEDVVRGQIAVDP